MVTVLPVTVAVFPVFPVDVVAVNVLPVAGVGAVVEPACKRTDVSSCHAMKFLRDKNLAE